MFRICIALYYIVLWRQARKAGHGDGVSKETEEAEELLLSHKPFAQFISPLTHLVTVSYFVEILIHCLCMTFLIIFSHVTVPL